MRHRLTVPLIASYLFLLCTAFQCGEELEPDYQYAFTEQLSLRPEQKSYRVGDTIWVQYRNPTTLLLDQLTNQPVAADTVSIPFQLSLKPRYNTPSNPVAGFCDFVTDQGLNVGRVHSSYGTIFFQEYGCSGKPGYDITVGVVLTQPGTYSLDAYIPAGSVWSCPTRRTRFPLSTITFSFAIADGNRDVLAAIPPTPGLSGYALAQLEELLASKKLLMVKVE
jgi:hypothetical protein